MIYISGAITGTSDYIERFKAAQDVLKSKGYVVINPALVNSNLPEKCSHDDYMTVSMALLSLCSTIYLLDGWNHSAGAKEEVAWAIEHGLLIITEPTFRNCEIPNDINKEKTFDFRKELVEKVRETTKEVIEIMTKEKETEIEELKKEISNRHAELGGKITIRPYPFTESPTIFDKDNKKECKMYAEINDKTQKSESFIEMLLYAVDCIRYYERISALHDCNDCRDKRNCRYAPIPGEFTRINCPLWNEK